MLLPDGVYFDLPEDIYHGLHRFSQSGITTMMESEEDYWENSWMNPDKEHNDDDTKAKLFGRAYHCRILEGVEAFKARYGFELAKSDPKFTGLEILDTNTEITEALKKAGVKGYSGLKKQELLTLAAANLESLGAVVFWEAAVQDHARRNEGRTLLPADWFMSIERRAMYIEKNPQLTYCFKSGVCEVTVLWTKTVEDNDGSGRRYKVPMKARMDYLRYLEKVKTEEGSIDILTALDLKNFENFLGKKLDQAVTSHIANYKLHIQSAVYYEALDELVAAFAEDRTFVWVPANALLETPAHPAKGRVGVTCDWKINPKAERRMMFVFQKKNGAPLAVGRTMSRELRIVDIGKIEADDHAVKFAKCMATFGPDPWVIPRAITPLSDDDMPAYMSY